MHVTLLLFLVGFLTRFDPSSAAPRNALTTVTESVGLENYDLNGRIVNGKKASLRQFPHQVSLRRSYNMKHFCGGSLITDRHVLTAAHCMYLFGTIIQPWTIVAVAGDLQLNKPSSTGQKKGVDKFVIHEGFDYSTLQNDIAVLQIKVPFTLTLEVNVVPLTESFPAPGTVCQIAGWGYPAEDIHVPNNDLMYVDIPVFSIETCRELLANISDIPPGMFCAGYIEGGKDACQGDSGGPMTCGDVLHGVISGGQGCAQPRLPGVYTDVSFYREWIMQKILTPLM